MIRGSLAFGVLLCCWLMYSLARWPGMGQAWARLVIGTAMLASVGVVVRQGFSMLNTLGLITGVVAGWYVVSRVIWIAALWPEAQRDEARFRANHPTIRR